VRARPIVVADGHYFSNVAAGHVARIVERTGSGLDKVDVQSDQRVFPVEVACARCNHSFMNPNYLIDGYPSIKVTISFGQVHGWLLLSCLYGSFNLESEYPIRSTPSPTSSVPTATPSCAVPPTASTAAHRWCR